MTTTSVGPATTSVGPDTNSVGPDTAAPATATPDTDRHTRTLLTAGVLAGPLFVTVVVLQELTRDGFDPKRHPLSLLSLGDLGWIQITNFVVCGALALASAFGLRRVMRNGRGGTWVPILVGAYGIGLIWGGVFLADPAFGFPVGTPVGMPSSMSWHGILHAIAPTVAGIAVGTACVIFARRYAGLGQRGWAWYCGATAVVSLALTWSSFPAGDYRLMLAGGAVSWIGLSVMTAHER
jgi:hypothetical protein